MQRIGIVGVGFMGMVHFLTYQKLRSAKVVALCDSRPRRLRGDKRDSQGNFGPPGERADLRGMFVTTDWRELVNRADADLVDVCLPPALHADVAVAALRSRKSVFCEKLIALELKQAQRMVRAAGDSGCPLMIGQVLPTFPEYACALQAGRSGRWGQSISSRPR